jgi:lipid-binding SYLF domain-containing protein
MKKEEAKMRHFHLIAILLVLAFAWGALISPNLAAAASAEEINRDCESALENLFAKSDTAKVLGENSRGVLVFPSIVKGGFMVGGQYGEGALLLKGKSPGVYKVAGYYRTVQVSYGLQAGIQKYGYALFLMTDSAMKWIDRSDGWELGTGPTLVVVDVGAARSLSTTTLQADTYAFFFDQKGLMGGLGLQGTKITKIDK